MEATSSDRVGEPSQFQARLVKFFLVLILLTLPGALSYLLRAEEPLQTSDSETPAGDRVAWQVDARDTGGDAFVDPPMRVLDRQGIANAPHWTRARGARPAVAGATIQTPTHEGPCNTHD